MWNFQLYRVKTLEVAAFVSRLGSLNHPVCTTEIDIIHSTDNSHIRVQQNPDPFPYCTSHLQRIFIEINLVTTEKLIDPF